MGVDFEVDLPLSIVFISCGVILTVLSQILLKAEAKVEHGTFWSQYLNARVITAYGLFFVVTVLNVLALRVLPLSYTPIWNAATFILVNIICVIVFKEKMHKKKLLGLVLILSGVTIFLL